MRSVDPVDPQVVSFARAGGLFHLAQQLDCARIAASGECGHPTGGINRHGAQKLGQLACCAGIEAAISAMYELLQAHTLQSGWR
jgi:hypothetical protein